MQRNGRDRILLFLEASGHRLYKKKVASVSGPAQSGPAKSIVFDPGPGAPEPRDMIPTKAKNLCRGREEETGETHTHTQGDTGSSLFLDACLTVGI
jgi:hypothetical protein